MGRDLQIAVDCADPEALAAFWAEVLDYRVPPPRGHATWRDYSQAEANEPGEGWCRADDPDGSGPSLLFHRVPEAKAEKNRLHLDVWVSHGGDWAPLDAEVERLVGLGASVLRRRDDDGHCYVVMGDPEGNEFCVCG